MCADEVIRTPQPPPALVRDGDDDDAAETSEVRLLSRLFALQEEEQRRLGIELHDLFGQQLTALSLRLSALAQREKVDLGIVREMQAIIAETGRQVHELASELRPPLLEELGLSAAVRSLVSAATGHSGLTVEYDAGGLGDRRVGTCIERTVYRVVQEALTNVVKHASATRVSVLLGLEDGVLEAIVEDDGHGIDLASQTTRRGLGIAGMRERVASVGGALELESRPGGGTTVFVRIPLQPS